MSTTAKPSYRSKLLDRVTKDAKTRLSSHTVTLLKSDGLYRHWQCRKPGTGFDVFDIVTWPGHLCYCGDMGQYLFRRTDDMVAFMRGSAASIGYAAEKCVANDGRLREYKYELFLEMLDETEQQVRDGDGEPEDVERSMRRTAELRRVVDEDTPEHKVYELIDESGLFDGCDFPNLKCYTFHFLWCLQSIQWFIAKIDSEVTP